MIILGKNNKRIKESYEQLKKETVVFYSWMDLRGMFWNP